jgi:hypothetical protein
MGQNEIPGNNQEQLIRNWNSYNSANQEEKDRGIAVLSDPKGH